MLTLVLPISLGNAAWRRDGCVARLGRGHPDDSGRREPWCATKHSLQPLSQETLSRELDAMLLAQLHRKVPSEFEGMEDVLTSCVFGLFKYLPVEVARSYLAEWARIPSLRGPLQVDVWPRYPTPPGFQRPGVLAEEDEDPAIRGDTEPDVLITTREWLILIEAKYRSPLDKHFDQLGREFAVGHQLAKETGRRLRLLVVTGHTLQPLPGGVDLVTGLRSALSAASGSLGDTASDMIAAARESLHWTNWQQLYTILAKASCDRDTSGSTRLLLADLCQLLELRGLKPFDDRALVAALARWEEAAIPNELWFVPFDYSYRLPSSVSWGWEQLLLMDLSALGPPAWHPEISRSDYDLGTHLGRFDLQALRTPLWSSPYQARR